MFPGRQYYKNIVDYFGGVRVNIQNRMYYKDDADGLIIDLEPGIQTLNGTESIKYLRFRKDLKADIGRMERQQKFMFTLASMILEKLEAKNIFGVYARLSKNVNTNLPPDRAAYLYKAFKNYDMHNSSKVILPGEPVYEDRIAYWKPDSRKIKEIFR